MSAPETPASKLSDSPRVAVFSMKQAAQVAGISVSTLRRRRTELEAAGATISPDGWQVPITALEALGLMRSPTPVSVAPPAPFVPPSVPKEATDFDALREAQKRIQELEATNVELRHRAELAEAIARERFEALNAERMALRMITGSVSFSLSDSQHAPEETTNRERDGLSAPTRTKWWKKLKGEA